MPTTINERAAPKLGPLGGGKTPSSTCDLRWSGAVGRTRRDADAGAGAELHEIRRMSSSHLLSP